VTTPVGGVVTPSLRRPSNLIQIEGTMSDTEKKVEEKPEQQASQSAEKIEDLPAKPSADKDAENVKGGLTVRRPL
jgi:hypothetical protein